MWEVLYSSPLGMYDKGNLLVRFVPEILLGGSMAEISTSGQDNKFLCDQQGIVTGAPLYMFIF